MKNFNKLTVGLAAIALILGAASCSDDDAVKSALKDPAIQNVAESVSSLTFSWDKVEAATQYGYELTDPAGAVVSTDVTTSTSVKFTGLQPATTYTLSVWAYSEVYGDNGTSKIATLTGTTASTVQLSTPVLTVETAGGTATISWNAIAYADSYGYSYSLGGEEDVADSTPDTYLEITNLVAGKEYTVSVCAESNNEVYTKSEVAKVTFTMTHSEIWRTEGTYTNAHLGTSYPVTMVAYDDESYALLAWYEVENFDFPFSVGSDGEITPYGDFQRNDKGEYEIPTGNESLPTVYLANEPASTFQGNSRSGRVTIRTCNYETGADTFVWEPLRQEVWRATGTYYSHVNDQEYAETLVAYDDNTYVLQPWYGVEGYDLEFKAESDGTIDIMSYYGIYDAGYWVNTGLDNDYYGLYVWPWNELSYISGNRMGGELILYTSAAGEPWGEDQFIWGEPGKALTIDDLVGTYTVKNTGMEFVTDYTNWYDFDFEYTDVSVYKSASDSESLVLDGFYWSGYPMTGKVDLESRTITFQPQAFGWYTFAGDESDTTPVYGTIGSDLNITVENWNGLYDGWYYFYNTKTVFVKQ
ncbi:MAG: fibronectin type III domain-containing protein [Muribaculum sp.]|nr:fibronectin type III domain-containing protein [Muribaculum sp.]